MPIRAVVSRSLLVGVAATVLDLGVLALLVHGAGVTPQAANVPALLVGLVAQFLGNKLVAFRDRSPDLLAQGLWFAAVEAGALVLNAALFHALVSATPIPTLLARAVTSGAVYLAYSLPLWGRIFRPTTA